MVIYKIVNSINGKFYIGKTIKTVEKRFSVHIYNAKRGGDTHLYRSIRKHGPENFSYTILESVISKEILNDREKFWIQELKPEYNMTKGGDGGDTSLSPKHKKSMKLYHARQPPETYATYGMLGKIQKKETKIKIGISNSYPVMCEGVIYSSVQAAEDAYPGISVRKRLDNKKYPLFYRLRPKRKYDQRN
jgi:group I intron endonuclease